MCIRDRCILEFCLFFVLTNVVGYLQIFGFVCLQMFYLVLLAVTASVHSVMYGPGAPLPVGPRLDGVSTNPFAGYMTLPIKRQGCQPASKYNVDAIFDRSFLCPKNTQMPQNWPTTVQNRFFIPDQQFQDYQK